MLYPRLPALNSIAKPLAISCSLLFFSMLLDMLFKQMLQKDKVSCSVLKYIRWLSIAILFTLIIYLGLPKEKNIPTLFNVGWHSCFVVSFACILLVLVRLFKENAMARLFISAMTIMVAMAVQQVLSNAGFFYNYILNEHGMLLASLAEILMLAFAIFKNIWEARIRVSMHIAKLEEAHANAMKQLVEVQDNERKRIAGDLHDSIGPMLAAIKINFFRVVNVKTQNKATDELVTKTENIIDNTLSEIRNISHQLMPKELSSKGLAASVQEYINNLKKIYAAPIAFKHNITIVMPQHVQLNVYRIISELVLNAVKHSKSADITDFIETAEKNIIIIVKDNGPGFDIVQANNSSSLGLKNIKSRVAYLKGAIQITSVLQKGTHITITIPNDNLTA
jgi:signal transduction histidine kinase